MRVSRIVALGIVTLVLVPATSDAAPPIGPGGGTKPPPQPGPITVQYRNGTGGLASTTSIPSGSAFRSQGGSDRAPCTFMYFQADPDGAGPLQEIHEPRQSLRWLFRETTDQVTELTDAEWIAAANLGGTDVASALAHYGPLESAFRRFDVYCVGTMGDGSDVNFGLGPTVVPPRDPFWDPHTRIDQLWTGLQLDRPVVATVPDSGLFGGLPVNMPSSLQIGVTPWRTYVSKPDFFRGWTSRLVLTPQSLAFDVAFDPDDGPASTTVVSCLDGSAEHPASGAMPRRASGVPDFAEPGQFEAPCVWIPPRPGQVTIRARVTYRVVFAVSGFTEVLVPYVWSSDPLTVRVDELRVVNVRVGK